MNELRCMRTRVACSKWQEIESFIEDLAGVQIQVMFTIGSKSWHF